MGLFDKRDKKKRPSKDDFDSPVEQIDLSAAPARKPASPPPSPSSSTSSPSAASSSASASSSGADKPVAKPKAAPVAKPAVKPEPARAAAKPEPARQARPAPARAAREPDPETPTYGIDKAIELMRTLPKDNVEIVVQVVKHTLESARIQIGDIIQDAARKQDSIQARIAVLKEEIAEFEAEIATRKSEIEGLDADFTETSLVRERLELAENLDKAKEDLNGSGKTDAKADASKPGKPDAEEATSASSGLGARKPATKPASKPDAKSSKTTVVVKK